MKKYQGKGVYGAVAVGKISLFKKPDAAVKRIRVVDTGNEKMRLEQAKTLAIEQLQMMLDDDDYNDSIDNIIDSQSVNAEYAVAVTADNFAEMFSAMDDEYMKARAADVRDISNRLINNLSGSVSFDTDTNEKVIICASDLAPSETVALDKNKVLAFVTAHGSSNSHTAILARNMNIPAIIGAGDEFLNEIKDGMEAIVDGYTGEVLSLPTR